MLHFSKRRAVAMQIIVNGNPTELAEGSSMAALIQGLGLAGQRLAVEVNEELVPRSRFAEHRLAPGDRVEIIHAVGGG
jgi:sulfur carrier protein